MTEGYGHNSGDDQELDEKAAVEASIFAELDGLSVDDILRAGQRALFLQLVTKARALTANHQELAILRNILKDNGMTLGIPPEKPAATEAPMDLPTYDRPDYE